MSFDLTDLMERTLSPPMHVELARVVSYGHRLRTRQRVRVAMVSVGVLALLGGVGAFEVRNYDAATPASTLGPISVTVPLNKNLFSFRLDTSGRVLFGRVVQGTTRVVSEIGATPVNGQVWVIVKDRPNVVLGVVPATEEASHIDAMSPAARGGFDGSADEDLGGGLKAYVREFADAQDATGFRGRVFTDGQDTVHGPGGVLPLAKFQADGGAEPVSVWLDPMSRTFGLLSRGQLSMRVGALTPIGGSVQEPVTSTSGRVYGLLPADASGVQVKFTPEVKVLAPLRTESLGHGWVAFYTEYSSPTASNVQATVVWRNRAGREQTHAAQ